MVRFTTPRRFACYVVGGIQLLLVLFVYTFFIQTTEYETAHASLHKPHIVLGILSGEDKRELRDAQRNTWIKSALQNDNPFKVTYTFLMNEPSNATIAENKIFNDILYLNVTYSGRAVRFGEKMYKWWKYVYENYPEALLAARIDDDVFVCVPQIFQRLYELRSSKLYYGWAHGAGKKIGVDRRVDEMFVVFGRDIIERISKRKYCENRATCNVTKDLVDLDFGGLSMGQWLSIYTDLDFHPDNKRIIHYKRGQEKKFAHLVRPDFCDKHFIFHKSTAEQMKQLNAYNNAASFRSSQRKAYNNSMTENEGALTGSLFSGSVIRECPLLNEYSDPSVKVTGDNMQNCDNWAVVTTIFERSEAVSRMARESEWCLVIVADLQTPDKATYMRDLASSNVKYLTIKEQVQLYPSLAETIPYKHFGRKNIGYVYAIQHKAKWIWDFDDDNIGVVDVDDFSAAASNYVTACEEFKATLVNPYPYFGVKDNRTWPRGFPLQLIKDNSTIPRICHPTEKPNIGVVQSLANVQPDVDAIFRLTRDVPFNFSAQRDTHPAFIVPRNVYTPFNAQATLWARQAFLYMALPLTVTGRVSDIWRSYIALHFMHKDHVQLAFSRPYVTQIRNEHMDIKDFNAEKHLYERSGQFVEFLSSDEARKTGSLLNMYEQLYRRGYIEINDLKFMNVWTRTLEIINK